jgi:hypothetical protein
MLPRTSKHGIQYLPPPTASSTPSNNIILNTNAAFEAGGLNVGNLGPNAPYIGPRLTLGAFGYLYEPWQNHFDVSMIKRIFIQQRYNVEFRATALDALNLTNFQLGSDIGSSFGQTTTAYRDLSNANDPAARVIEFQLRVNL